MPADKKERINKTKTKTKAEEEVMYVIQKGKHVIIEPIKFITEQGRSGWREGGPTIDSFRG